MGDKDDAVKASPLYFDEAILAREGLAEEITLEGWVGHEGIVASRRCVDTE
jgi:hypothetical protein